MVTEKLSDEAFLAILTAHPWLRDRFASIARTVEGCDGYIKEADAIEERLLGRAAMQGWAENQIAATEREIRQQPRMQRQGKKNSAGTRNSATSRSWSRNIGS